MFENLLRNIMLTDPPYLHFLFCDKQKHDDLILLSRLQYGSCVIEIDASKCGDEQSLFTEFSFKLQFPSYFGFNWAAFDECINDLDWLECKNYCIIIRNADQLFESSVYITRTFLYLLEKTALEWAHGRNYDDFPTEPTPFHLIFQSEKEIKDGIVNSIEKFGLDKKNFEFIKQDL